MIPYDDLVVALASWRAKQGLPVATANYKSGPVSGPTMTAAPSAPAPSTGSGSGPKRGAPPAPPGRTTAPAAAIPAPLPLPAETIDVDDALDLHEHLDEHHEVDDDQLPGAFGDLAPETDEATSIGGTPPRDSFGGHTDPNPLDKRGRNDW